MIVVTLSKVPPSLRGDLTKWYQEIQTGVYVGNVSARVRDLLWERILKNIGTGEATMAYNAATELGYQFRTTRKDRQVFDYDGIPLMMHLKQQEVPVKHGFSSAAKFHKGMTMSHRRMTKYRKDVKPILSKPLVALDLETTGLDSTKAEIISIGAAKIMPDGQLLQFEKLIRSVDSVPSKITELTGITSEQLQKQGVELSLGLEALSDFVKDSVIIGYNLEFDERFLTEALRKVGKTEFTNSTHDLMPIVKTTQEFLDNYRLTTVLEAYQIENLDPHHALSDAQATLSLAEKLIKNGDLII
ncbi:type I-E CRISPR-associated endoribonuclease Cas2e [Companilactobacillus paralimentarius]|uniref:type I-E CRISPR-associated endoribonuclease Cas2e n=1 Tax=Companilactobacillus paralimentarius TaxID=83526 RepID=UPI00384DCF75